MIGDLDERRHEALISLQDAISVHLTRIGWLKGYAQEKNDSFLGSYAEELEKSAKIVLRAATLKVGLNGVALQDEKDKREDKS